MTGYNVGSGPFLSEVKRISPRAKVGNFLNSGIVFIKIGMILRGNEREQRLEGTIFVSSSVPPVRAGELITEIDLWLVTVYPLTGWNFLIYH